MTNLEAHPVADLFPMLAEDELADLAADIADRGLLQPIVLDAEGRVLDGRNRLAACRIAEVDPEFVTYDGDDPDGYALAVNIARRHLTKGQQAMVIARGYKDYTEDDRRRFGVSKQYVSWARTALSHAPDLADAVVAGAIPLDEAYKVARERKQAAQSTDAQLERLRATAPDLADLVAEERLSLAGAVAEQQNREAAAERDRVASRSAQQTLVSTIQSTVATIVVGVEAGEPMTLDHDALSTIRKTLDQLEEQIR